MYNMPLILTLDKLFTQIQKQSYEFGSRRNITADSETKRFNITSRQLHNVEYSTRIN